MKGFTGIKDLDLKILSELDDKDLTSVSLANRYLNNLCKDENLWYNKTRKYFIVPETSETKKGEHVTWREFYIHKLLREKTFLGELTLLEFKYSPAFWNLELPSNAIRYYRDEYDNWLIHHKKNRYIYLSCIQYEGEISTRIRIDLNKSHNLNPIKINVLHFDFLQSVGALKEVTEIQRRFFANKNKSFYLDRAEKSRSSSDLLNIIYKKTPLLAREII